MSPHPNLVTNAGLRQIETRVRELETELRAVREARDSAALARVNRDRRYWAQRRASARLVEPRPDPRAIRFGVRATVRFDDGREQSFCLVGEDEADPKRGLVSWVAPFAAALTGKTLGDRVDVLGSAAEIVALEPSGSRMKSDP